MTSSTRTVVVLGAGNGGCTLAADLTLRGFSVTLVDLPEFDSALQPIRDRGGIQLSGVLGEHFVAPHRITTDISEALDDAGLVLISVPAFAHAIMATRCAPHLRPDHTLVLNPGSTGGALVFARLLLDAGVADGVIVAETMSLPYACAKQNPTHIHVYGVKADLPIAAFPANKTSILLQILDGVYPGALLPAQNVFETSLNNLNAIAHPFTMLLNVGWLESNQGGFLFYPQGISPTVAEVMEAADCERMGVARALGLPAVSLVEWDRRQYGLPGGTLYEMMHGSVVHGSLKAPPSLNHRFLNEDVPYGLVPYASLGKTLGLALPVTELFVHLACLLRHTDFWSQGYNVEKLGLAGLNAEQMLKVVNEGWRATASVESHTIAAAEQP